MKLISDKIFGWKLISVIVIFLIYAFIKSIYIDKLDKYYTYSTGLNREFSNGTYHIRYCFQVNGEKYSAMGTFDDRTVVDYNGTYIIEAPKGNENYASVLLDYRIPDSLYVKYPEQGWNENPYVLKECNECLNGKILEIKSKFRIDDIGKIEKLKNYYCN